MQTLESTETDVKWRWNRGKSGSSRAFHDPFVDVELTNPTELVPLLLLALVDRTYY